MHPYIPHTQADIEAMLQVIGEETLDALFGDINSSALLSAPLKLPKQHSEKEILKKLNAIASENANSQDWLNFAGGGIYDHLVPTIVGHLISRSEFYTAYTPYQPEISQGTLQAIFEYQTMMSEITGLPVVNASHYDGATALAEAAFMAANSSKGDVILVAQTLPDESRHVLETYLKYRDLKMVVVPENDEGVVSIEEIRQTLLAEGKNVCAYIVASPNRYGNIEDLRGVADLVHDHKALFVLSANPMAYALYKTPAEWGADIACGDAQVFGNTMNFGGPALGYIACSEKLMRKMPGRIVGRTKDLDGKTGYVLTLQAREQHIRREKATSNITSNQALNALAATIYLSVMGPDGYRQAASRSRSLAHYLKHNLSQIEGIEIPYSGEFFNEFVIEVPSSKLFNQILLDQGIIGGIELSDTRLLIATTEKLGLSDVNAYVEAAKEVF